MSLWYVVVDKGKVPTALAQAVLYIVKPSYNVYWITWMVGYILHVLM